MPIKMKAKTLRRAQQVIDLAIEKKVHIGTAESCTGGMIGAALTAIPGSSKVYIGGIIAYDNSIKNMQLGVPAGMIHKYGAVSKYVAASMAKGAAINLNTDLTVSVTGIAGPSGGSTDKPVGTVYIGMAKRNGEDIKSSAKLHKFGAKNRNKVRVKACNKALKCLIKALKSI